MTRSFLIFVLLFGCLSFSGCNGKQVGLSGKIVFSDDGSPVTFGTVCFATSTFQAKGEIKKNGTFTMGSLSASDGLPPGTYQVYFLGLTEDLGGESIYSILDPKWNSPSTTDLTVTIEKTTSNLEIKVDRNPETREQFQNKKKNPN
jgi:hypothetical protein